eukprot:224361-Rhodomonas_salina.1
MAGRGDAASADLVSAGAVSAFFFFAALASSGSARWSACSVSSAGSRHQYSPSKDRGILRAVGVA